MPVTAVFREEGVGDFQKSIKEMPQRVQAVSMQRYFLTMFTAMEQIFMERFMNSSFAPKQRSWASSIDPVLQKFVQHGTTPLVRTGLLLRSLTEPGAQFSIRKMGHRVATFGTSRPFVYKGALNPNLARVLNEGAVPKGQRFRMPVKKLKLRWEPGAGFTASTYGSTSDMGATIPPRPFLFDRRPLTGEERRRLDQTATQFWTSFFRLKGMM